MKKLLDAIYKYSTMEELKRMNADIRHKQIQREGIKEHLKTIRFLKIGK